ncbi:uncharacterized protein LOC115228573 [Octopus sinensis]|uniref:Uncharacterized protein LOC115228573 n=1 Tax=Octopus sinensis TaxID=2607531 RepID=A0A6P7U1Z3_9MOLL|nr:uncharacterized protein LOC115228573 [Octopus sinensis]
MSSPESVDKYEKGKDGQFPGRSLTTSHIPQSTTDFTKVNRRKRCGECEPCKVKENCNKCKNCLNRKILKQTCILRRCHFLHHKSGSDSSQGGKRKRGPNKKSPEVVVEVPQPEPPPEEPVKTPPPVEPMTSSEEIEKAVKSLLEASKNRNSEEEQFILIPDDIILPPPPLSSISTNSSATRNTKSPVVETEVVKSISLPNSQMGLSFKIVPSTQMININQSHYAFQPMPAPVMVMGRPEIPRHNIVLARMPQRIGEMNYRPNSEIYSSQTSVSTSSPPCSFGNDYTAPKVHRRKRCGQCRPCLIKENCMKCKNCINRKVLKQTCIHRKCLYLREKMRKDSGFCSSPIIDQTLPQPTPTQPPLLEQLYDMSSSSSSFVTSEDQFRPQGIIHQNSKGADLSFSGHILSQSPIIPPGHHIQLWPHPCGPGVPQGFPMIAAHQGGYFQLRPQTQLGGYARLMGSHEQRYYVQPAMNSVNSFHEFSSITRPPIRVPQRAEADIKSAIKESASP